MNMVDVMIRIKAPILLMARHMARQMFEFTRLFLVLLATRIFSGENFRSLIILLKGRIYNG
jgi:hypothetical protein